MYTQVLPGHRVEFISSQSGVRLIQSGVRLILITEWSSCHHHRVEFVIAETYGNESYSIQRTVELTRRNISAYIGPQETCIHEARIASVFDLPMISYVSSLLVHA